ncbi:MAG TPA: pyrroloquinoline quinone biosynthesis peptide chaperone PqqD [Rhizomicrobium sp.]|jgi:pyrroloquinoline quinone biosynthesis protein D|nr:pyrroloquinoline quinone biosynthesis peptide chaperone PqqD [Rhizomicrobium sp.]
MNTRSFAEPFSRPRLAPHRRLQFDKMRDIWTVQAPERAFVLDETAHAIVSRCNGEAKIETIVDDLCRAYEGAPRDAVAADVLKLVQEFLDKGVMTL